MGNDGLRTPSKRIASTGSGFSTKTEGPSGTIPVVCSIATTYLWPYLESTLGV